MWVAAARNYSNKIVWKKNQKIKSELNVLFYIFLHTSIAHYLFTILNLGGVTFYLSLNWTFLKLLSHVHCLVRNSCSSRAVAFN